MHKQKPHNKVKCKAWQSERNKAKKVEFFLWIVYEFCGYAWAILNLPTKMQYDFPKPIFVSSRFYSKTKKTRRKRCGIFKCCFKMEKVPMKIKSQLFTIPWYWMGQNNLGETERKTPNLNCGKCAMEAKSICTLRTGLFQTWSIPQAHVAHV